MGKDVRNTKKMLDYIKLIISLVALVIIVGGLIYESKGVIYPIDVNIVVSFMLAFYVLFTGMEIHLLKDNKNIGYFLMLCSMMILILNIIAMAF